MNNRRLHFKYFKLANDRSYEDWTLNNRKKKFYKKGEIIERISDWKIGHYYNHEFKKIESYFADFRFKNGDIQRFMIDDEIDPIDEQLTLF